jgi:hypothetical protein
MVGQSNSPARTPVVNADHCAAVNFRAAPVGSLESRTARDAVWVQPAYLNRLRARCEVCAIRCRVRLGRTSSPR